MEQITYFDHMTGTYFEATEEIIEHELDRINSRIRYGLYSTTVEALSDLYKAMGVKQPKCWHGIIPAVEFKRELKRYDLPFEEVEGSETEDKEEEEMNERQIMEFIDINVEASTCGTDRPIAILVNTDDGTREIWLSEDNVKFLIKALKSAVKLINA